MHTLIQNDLDYIADFDRTLWDGLKGKKIFATGCTGFIGAWITHSFLHLNKKYNLNAELTLLTRDKDKVSSDPSIHILHGDIKNFDLPPGKFDFVIHGATEVAAFQSGANPSEMLDVAYLGTKRMIEMVKKASVPRVLFLSSGAAYGPQPLEMDKYEESYLGAPATKLPKSTYGEAKRLGEMLLFNEDSFSSVSARIFAASGPFLPMKSDFAFSNFLEACLKDEKIVITGNGKTTRSYLYAADITLWLWILLIRGESKEIYNVGSEEEISILDLAQTMKKVLNKNIQIEVQGKETGFGRYIPSNQKIRSSFHIKSIVTFEDSIRKSYDYLKATYAV